MFSGAGRQNQFAWPSCHVFMAAIVSQMGTNPTVTRGQLVDGMTLLISADVFLSAVLIVVTSCTCAPLSGCTVD